MIRLGLLGYPLSHSLSPKIHAMALEYFGLTGRYDLYPVHPDQHENISALIVKVRSGEVTGLNVTIPHKQAVLKSIDRLSLTAEKTGAVNTISSSDGLVIGDNTDYAGFWNDFSRFLLPSGKTSTGSALILGAGGSARAVTCALLDQGWDICIAARKSEQAEEMLHQFTQFTSNLTWIPLNAQGLSRLPFQPDAIINTTPAGMHPHTEENPWPAGVQFPKNSIVYDLIYNPAKTRLLRDAEKAGLKTRNGQGMLVEQALQSFSIWTGKKCDMALYQQIMEDLWE